MNTYYFLKPIKTYRFYFDIECVITNKILGLLTVPEIKFLCFNILTYIGDFPIILSIYIG